MINTPEFKVGALVVIVSGLIGVMSLKVNEGPGLFSRTKRYYFDINDAGGLVENSAVKSAGIRVGSIEKIELVDDKARIHVILNGDLKMRTSGYVDLRSDGILGDRHVEMVPGKNSDPELPDNSAILTANERGSLNAVMKEISKIADSISKVADNLNKATGAEGDTTTTIGRIAKNVEKLTQDISEVTGKNKEKLNEIIDNVHDITKELAKVVNDKGPEGFQSDWHKLSSTLDRLDASARNIEEISSKVNKGEGTIGRLINDDETVNKIDEAVTSLNDFLGGANTLQTSFDFHSEYLAGPSMTKTYVSVLLQPGLDRYYELGVVDDPRGLVDKTQWTDSGTYNQNYTETKTYYSKVSFTALFAKNFYDFTFKGGIMESTGGFGFDYYLTKKHDLRFSIEAYDFQNFALKSYLRYNAFKGFYLIGGGDHITDSELHSAFIGAGLYITNDDIKYLSSAFKF
jgi:phospholipid/cholesterol/gamma-HCH transport system substrate-binding protein